MTSKSQRAIAPEPSRESAPAPACAGSAGANAFSSPFVEAGVGVLGQSRFTTLRTEALHHCCSRVSKLFDRWYCGCSFIRLSLASARLRTKLEPQRSPRRRSSPQSTSLRHQSPEKAETGSRRVGVIRARATPDGFRQFIRDVRGAGHRPTQNRASESTAQVSAPAVAHILKSRWRQQNQRDRIARIDDRPVPMDHLRSRTARHAPMRQGLA